MPQYFAYDFKGVLFMLFRTWHLAALVVIALIYFAVLRFRIASDKKRTIVRWSMGNPLVAG